jgi:predicted acyltransferase
VRLGALDVFRGATIALMILVNTAGASDHYYYFLDHAPWAGWTPTDLVFPFFLFAVGMAVAVSQGRPRSGVSPYPRIFKRTLVLFAIGVGGNALMPGSLRFMGVLQRISLCYLAVSLLALHLSVRAQAAVCAAILVGYWLALTRAPVPGYGAGVLTREGNFASYLDRLLIGSRHLYYGDGWKGLGDPEGLSSTLPAVASTMFGYFAGLAVRDRQPDPRLSRGLLLAGAALIAAGSLWGLSFPVVKKIWTSSYAVLMGGISLVVFALCYEISEVRGRGALMEPLAHFGRNSLAAFVGSLLLLRLLDWLSLLQWINARLLARWLSPNASSAAFALFCVALWWAILRALDRRGWHLKA